LASWLLPIHKIVNEEFLDPDSDKSNESFYNSKIKSGFIATNQVINEDSELFITLRILKEIEMKKYIEKAFIELGKRIFMEKEYSKFAESDDDANSQDMQKLLKMFSGPGDA